MNTFENELSTQNLASLLSCKAGVDIISLNSEDKTVVLYGDSGMYKYITGPCKVLIVPENKGGDAL